MPTDGRYARFRIARSTFKVYESDLRRHVLPRLGDRLLTELTAAHVDRLIFELDAEGKAAEGIRNVIVPLRKMLGEATRQELVPKNVASKCKLPPAQDFAGKEIPPEECEAIRWALALSAPADPIRGGQDFLWVHAFDLALGTGLRMGELRELRWSDVDLERRLIRVRRAISAGEASRPKSKAGIREVPIFESVRVALEALGKRAIDHGTATSRLFERGADSALVQAIGGWSDPRIMDRYTHVREARISDAAERFDTAAVSRALADEA